MRSLGYYVEAADAALLHLSPAACMSFSERALALLEGATLRPQYTPTEVTLWALRGVASFHLLGVVDETRDAFRHAHGLLQQVPDHPMRGLVLHGLGFVHCLRAEYEEATPITEQAVALAASSGDGVIQLAAYTVQGQVNLMRGQPRAARTWLERGLPLLESAAETSGRSFAADPAVTVLAMLALQLLHLGLVRQGRARVLEAHARADRLGQPTARMIAIWYEAPVSSCGSAIPSVSRRWPMRCTRSPKSLRWRTVERRATWFGGWADAQMGLPSRAIDGFGTRTRPMCDSGCWRARARPSAMPRRPCCSAGTGARRSSNSRRH